MMRDCFIDFHFVEDEHLDIHQRLENWAKWVKPQSAAWMTQPMFRHYRSHAWQWERPAIQNPIDRLGAHKMEKQIAALPQKNRDAVRWSYYFKRDPIGMAKALGVSRENLFILVKAGRTMLKNRTQSITK